MDGAPDGCSMPELAFVVGLSGSTLFFYLLLPKVKRRTRHLDNGCFYYYPADPGRVIFPHRLDR